MLVHNVGRVLVLLAAGEGINCLPFLRATRQFLDNLPAKNACVLLANVAIGQVERSLLTSCAHYNCRCHDESCSIAQIFSCILPSV